MIVDWLTASGLAWVKPLLSALVLPPTPFIVLALVAAFWRRRRIGVALTAIACAGLWLSACTGMIGPLQRLLLDPPPPLSAADRADLAARAARGERIAIIELGGGIEPDSHEYGDGPELTSDPLARLRYAVWLGRATGIPVGTSGGIGWGSSVQASSEAEITARTATRDFHAPLRWQEGASRDTHENAVNTLALLRPDGIQRIVLVTHNWHMPRALREFRAAAAAAAPAGGAPIVIEAAPVGPTDMPGNTFYDWLPSSDGLEHVREAIHEAIGLHFAH